MDEPDLIQAVDLVKSFRPDLSLSVVSASWAGGEGKLALTFAWRLDAAKDTSPPSPVEMTFTCPPLAFGAALGKLASHLGAADPELKGAAWTIVAPPPT